MMGKAAEDRAASKREMEGIVARFWPRAMPESCPAAETGVDDPRRVALAVAAGFVAVHADNYPTAGNVSAAKEWNPAASALLDRWADAWSRSFPAGLPEELADHLNESDGPRPNETAWLASLASSADGYLAAGRFDKAGDPACQAAAWLARPSRAGMRDWRAHVVDDAEAVDSLRHAEPGEAFLQVGNATFVLEGHRGDGSPILAPLAKWDRERIKRILDLAQSTADVGYWNSPAFLAAAGRGFAVCKAERELHVTLLAMAMAGHRKAFLKGMAGKSGTWTVDLSDVRTPDCAMREIARAGIRWSVSNSGILVQEHVPFLFEQRFFVVSGRIVASVCSDRNHSAADARRDRILDERVARLDVPEIDHGEYDRGVTGCVVDRELSAAFARAARRIVRSLRGEVREDYVIDMGLSDRGVLPVELNRLYCSGPYSLSRHRIVGARKRLAAKARAAVAERVPEWMGKHRIEGNRAAVSTAAALMPLRSIAAAVDDSLEPKGRVYARNATDEATRAFVLAARNLCAAGIGAPALGLEPRPALEPSEAMAFAFMRGFEPLASVPLTGFASREMKVSRRGHDDGDLVPGYSNEAARCRLCVGVRPSPDGGILAFALATQAGMGADVRPLELQPWRPAEDPEDESLALCMDALRGEVILRRARPGRGGWSLCLERRGEADVSMDMPELAIGADGYPLAHSWETGKVREPCVRIEVHDFAYVASPSATETGETDADDGLDLRFDFDHSLDDGSMLDEDGAFDFESDNSQNADAPKTQAGPGLTKEAGGFLAMLLSDAVPIVPTKVPTGASALDGGDATRRAPCPAPATAMATAASTSDDRAGTVV